MICNNCNGKGEIPTAYYGGQVIASDNCPVCHGTGWINDLDESEEITGESKLQKN